MSTSNEQTGNLPPQSMLHQRYIVIGQAGRGGMGAVYQAIDTRMAQRQVAIKEMGQSALSQDQVAVAMARFQQEVAILGSLSHPNLPRIYDAFSGQERIYFVMDYIEGKTFHQLLKEGQWQPMPVSQVLYYALQLCDVLAYLHQQTPPIIFRDVKPTNIMVTQTGQVFLIDFGIARIFKEGQQQDTEFLGSRGYASPEQHGIFQTNPRTDIYGLGATLHFCLTGQDPHYATDPFAFSPVQQSNPQVPLALAQLIQCMVAIDEQLRPANMLEVQQALLAITRQATDSTSTIGSPPQSAPVLPLPYPNDNRVAISPTQVASNAPNQLSIPATHPMSQSSSPFSGYSPSLRQPDQPRSSNFTIFLGTFLLLTLGICVAAFFSFYPTAYEWALISELGAALLFWLTTGIAYWIVNSSLPRSILAVTNMAALITGFSLLAIYSPDVQVGLQNLLSPGFPYQDTFHTLLNISLTAAGIISLGWLLRASTWIRGFILFVSFGSAIVCAFLQAAIQLDTDMTKHILLLIALIALIEGVLVAIHIERRTFRP
jgi:serine/threonine protein kinase